MLHVKRPDHEGFRDRLGFLRWVWHLDFGEPPTNEAIGNAAEHTGQWLTGLLKAGQAPTKGADQHAVSAFFGVEADWLIYNQGDPPRGELWLIWRAARSVPTTGPGALAHVVRQTTDQSELERKDIPAARPKRKPAS